MISGEIIDAVLARGSGVHEGKLRIFEQYALGQSEKENAVFLKEELVELNAELDMDAAKMPEETPGKEKNSGPEL